MSHFSRIKTDFKNREILINCLQELGYKMSYGGKITGYEGKQAVDFAVTLQSGYDIGFIKDVEGTYNVVADWWGVEGTDEASFTNEIRRTYALRVTLAQVKKQGFNVVSQEQKSDGTIKLLARRWS